MNDKRNTHYLKHDQEPQSDHSSDHYPQPLQPQSQSQPQQRRPRGFAATAAAAAASMGVAGGAGGGVKGKKEREREKERTKLRERHRRAITSRMLAGLRQYGNFPLPARADMNDVLAALAREAGWTVEPDGTTYRSSPPPSQTADRMDLPSIKPEMTADRTTCVLLEYWNSREDSERPATTLQETNKEKGLYDSAAERNPIAATA